MAKILNPLFSQVASGDFGKAMTFVCGRFCRVKNDNAKEPNTAFQLRQQAKFAAAVNLWNTFLTKENRNNWHKFMVVMAAQNVCIDAKARMTGYNVWITYYLRFSEYGWPFYPDPPIQILEE